MGRVAETGDGSTLSLDFTTMSGTLDSRITFSRADATARATFFNSSGIVTTVASAQAPRFDFDPTTFVAKGLLLEAPATNTVTYSGDFTQNSAGNWSVRTGLITTGSPPWTGFSSPDGGTAAVKLIADTPSTRHSIENYNPSIVTGTTYTASAFVKASGYTVANLTIGGGQARRNFTLSGAGSVGSGFGVTSTGTITPIGSDGWYRITMTWTSTVSGSGAAFWVAIPQNATTDSVNSWAGNGTSGIFAWGAQLEVGEQASSYIATTTGNVTRAVDTAIIAAGTNFSSWYTGGTTGTFVSNWYGSASSSTARSVIATNDQTTKHLHMYQTPSALTLRLADFPVTTVTTANSLTANALARGAFSYASTATSLCLNGGTVATGTLAFTVAPTWLSIGGPSTNGTSITTTTVMLNNSIRTLKYFPTRLSDAQIQTLTTP